MLWRVQQCQLVHQSRQSSLKPTVVSANPSQAPRDLQLPAWQCCELQPRPTPRLTVGAPVRKAYRHRAYQGPDSRCDRWYRTSHQRTFAASFDHLVGAVEQRAPVRPSDLAVLRLTIGSTFVTCWTGRSAGFSPLRRPPEGGACSLRCDYSAVLLAWRELQRQLLAFIEVTFSPELVRSANRGRRTDSLCRP